METFAEDVQFISSILGLNEVMNYIHFYIKFSWSFCRLQHTWMTELKKMSHYFLKVLERLIQWHINEMTIINELYAQHAYTRDFQQTQPSPRQCQSTKKA